MQGIVDFAQIFETSSCPSATDQDGRQLGVVGVLARAVPYLQRHYQLMRQVVALRQENRTIIAPLKIRAASCACRSIRNVRHQSTTNRMRATATTHSARILVTLAHFERAHDVDLEWHRNLSGLTTRRECLLATCAGGQRWLDAVGYRNHELMKGGVMVTCCRGCLARQASPASLELQRARPTFNRLPPSPFTTRQSTPQLRTTSISAAPSYDRQPRLNSTRPPTSPHPHTSDNLTSPRASAPAPTWPPGRCFSLVFSRRP
ncbi:hypothetical protein FB567DRAFT_259970 [Paraphoma chrysanthemicola]|uniref:Uncharacterized protein n=1 Tax=Paraphoma chrysanthemicola TaxID=798071 RepID=A0A8K0QQU3_9PLEO|nr:hypothetical protein FB567DRAFT_259970 [Paraphoma chrysanthemicola]